MSNGSNLMWMLKVYQLFMKECNLCSQPIISKWSIDGHSGRQPKITGCVLALGLDFNVTFRHSILLT